MRWIVQDPATGTSYTFPLNPNRMTSPLPTMATAEASAPPSWGFGEGSPIGPRTRINNPDPVQWQFQGYAHDAAMVSTLKNIFNLKGRLYLTDHFGRQLIVRFLTADVDERTPTIKNPNRYAYTVPSICYGQVP